MSDGNEQGNCQPPIQDPPVTIQEPAISHPPIYPGTQASPSNSERLPDYDDQLSPPKYDSGRRLVSHNYRTQRNRSGQDVLDAQTNLRVYTIGSTANNGYDAEQQAQAASRPSPSTGPSDAWAASSTTGTNGRGNLLRYVRNRIGQAPDQSKGLNELLVMGWTPELAEELYQLLARQKTTVKELESMVRLQRLSRVTLDETLRILGDMTLRTLQAAGLLP